MKTIIMIIMILLLTACCDGYDPDTMRVGMKVPDNIRNSLIYETSDTTIYKVNSMDGPKYLTVINDRIIKVDNEYKNK